MVKRKLRELIFHLKRSAFVKNVLLVMSGSAVAQVLGLALTPIISRLFTPSDFGIFGSFNSVASIIVAGATFQYTQAIMLPKEKGDAMHLLAVSCLCTFTVALILLVVCFIVPSRLNGVMKTNGTWALSLLVAVAVVSGLNESCQAWCVREKAFKHTSGSQVVRGIFSNGMQIGFGYLKTGAAGLIVSNIIADILATMNLARVVLRDLSGFRMNLRWIRMKQLIKEYRDFPMYSATMNVISSLSLGLPVLLLTQFYGIAVAGAYAFGMRLLTAPMGFVLNALRQVLFQKAAEAHNDGDRLMPLYIKITLGLFAFALFPSLVIFMWAPQLFASIFGPQWHIAGEFVRSLVLWMMFMFCNLPAVLFARILRIQRKMFVFDLIVLFTRTIVLFAGGLYLSAVYTILLISIVGAVLNIIFILIVGFILLRKESCAELNVMINEIGE